MEDKVKTVFFVRHGETEDNIRKVTQNHESMLSEAGIRQAEIIAERAKNIDFEHLIASDFSRAKVTAEHISRATGKEIEFSELFREYRRPSEFWGRSIGEHGKDKWVFEKFTEMESKMHDKDWHFSDEENFHELRGRAQKALKYLEDSKYTRILVVTHGNFLRVILGVILHKERYCPEDYKDIDSTFKLSNTSISVAQHQLYWRHPGNVWRIKAWNDHAHLGEID